MNTTIQQHALRLLEEGKSEAYILQMYPKHTKELEKYFHLIALLKLQKNTEKCVPNPLLLKDVLEKTTIGNPTQKKIASPYMSRGLFFRIKNTTTISIFAVLLVLGGRVLYTHHVHKAGQQGQTEQTDDILGQDIMSIDAQLDMLDDENEQAETIEQSESYD